MIGKTRTGLPTHERLPDLLAASDDPHPRKTRRIEFVGDYNPMDDDVVVAKLLLSESGRNDVQRPYTPTIIDAIRYATFKAVRRIVGFSVRIMEHDHRYALAPDKHLSRTYQWNTANNFIADVEYRDVDTLLGMKDGHQFRDLDAMEHDEPKVITPSPEVFKLIAVEAVPSMSAKGVGPQHGDVLAAH